MNRIPERTFLDYNFSNDYNLVDRKYRGNVDFLLSGHEAVPAPRVAVWRARRRIPFTVDLRFFMNYNDQMQNLLRWVEDPHVLIVANVWHPEITHDRILFTDFYRDVTKAYHQGYQFSTTTHPLMMASRDDYDLASINDRSKATKIWLSPSSTNTKTHQFRPKLFEFMKSRRDQGFLGNPAQGIILYSNSDVLVDLETNHFMPARFYKGLSYEDPVWRYKLCPPHRAYYEHSFVSIYSETVEHGRSLIVTEKTYFAFIQGHFVLPFSCAGFITRLQQLGFRMPDFIDYSYDNEPNDQRRQKLYLQEVDRVCSWNVEHWHQLWNDNINVIKHNRQCMLDKPFDHVDFSKLLN